jgi:hypothetical protein
VLAIASLSALIAAAGVYAVLCATSPFRPSGRLRLGRRALNSWRRARAAGTR